MSDEAEHGRAPLRLVVMGVSGSGKSTVGEVLAKRLSLPYADADDFHSPANVAKMQAGQSLTDEDRQPWLEAIGHWLEFHAPAGAIVTCSALKRSHRDVLRRFAPDLRLLFLSGDRKLLTERMGSRQGHFMPSSLLQSQLDALEPPDEDEVAVEIEVDRAPEDIAETFVNSLAVSLSSLHPDES
ncbi:MAG: gluconokinase [Nocardioidaceae bacterium]